MLVKDCMTRDPVTVSPDTAVLDALELMKNRKVRRLPVIDRGRLVGIVAGSDLLKVSPSPATSLSIYEIHYLISKMTLKDAMTKSVVTVSPDAPVEQAALVMRDHRVGGLPVVDDSGRVVGIITETDVFKAFIELMGLERAGSRVTVRAEDRLGVLAEITEVIRDTGISIVSMAASQTEGGYGEIVLRLAASNVDRLVVNLEKKGHKVLHVA